MKEGCDGKKIKWDVVGLYLILFGICVLMLMLFGRFML